jgi:hypothetical protein
MQSVTFHGALREIQGTGTGTGKRAAAFFRQARFDGSIVAQRLLPAAARTL